MMRTKRWLITALVVSAGVGSAVGLTSHAATTTNPQNFISSLKSPVQTVANQYKLYPSVMMAQAALESGWGTSQLTLQANNYFGIKGSYNGQSVTMQTSEYDANGQLYYTDANFRKYPNAKASMTDNAKLLRNGTSYNPTIYSGTWRENAATYADAANALTNTYATAPTYGASLIALITQYNLNSLDGDAAASSSSSSTSSSSSSNSSDGNSVTPQPVYAQAKYHGATGNQMGRLGTKYRSYRLYNHIKGTRAKVTKTAWTKVHAYVGQPVYFDMRGVKQNPETGKKTTWYRVRFSTSKSAKKYWVYTKALTLPKVTYTSGQAKVKLSATAKGSYYDHVYNSAYLAKAQGSLKDLANQTYTADNQAVKTQDGVASTWYRIKVGDKKYWVASATQKVSPDYDYASYTAASGTKKLGKKFAKYHPYNHVKKTHFDQVQLKWPAKAKVGTKVTVNQEATKPKYQTTWYRIQFKGDSTNYWVDAKALS